MYCTLLYRTNLIQVLQKPTPLTSIDDAACPFAQSCTRFPYSRHTAFTRRPCPIQATESASSAVDDGHRAARTVAPAAFRFTLPGTSAPTSRAGPGGALSNLPGNGVQEMGSDTIFVTDAPASYPLAALRRASWMLERGSEAWAGLKPAPTAANCLDVVGLISAAHPPWAAAMVDALSLIHSTVSSPWSG